MSDSAKQKVLAVYPDAEAHSNDHYYHWIGRKTLSDAFEQNWDQLDKVDAMPSETDEEVQACIDARNAVEEEAEGRAWDDAASKLPSPPAPQGSGEHKLAMASPAYCPKCGRGDGAPFCEHAWEKYHSMQRAELPPLDVTINDKDWARATMQDWPQELAQFLACRERQLRAALVETSSLRSEIGTLSTLGAEQVLEIQELRQVVKEYRQSNAEHEECEDYGAPQWEEPNGIDARCAICIKSDALLEPKAKPTQQGDKE